MRKILAAALLPLAALLAAAKPVDGVRDIQTEARRSIFGAQATAYCATDQASNPANGNSSRICSCAAERYLANHPGGDLPAINNDNYRTILAAELTSCGGDSSPGGKTADDGLPRGAIAPPTSFGTPAAEPAAPGSTDSRPPSGSMFAWLDDLGMPSISGMPDWGWWALLGLLIVFFFARRVLRGDATSHLDGPPSSMRVSAPVQPRHPNLPPRG